MYRPQVVNQPTTHKQLKVGIDTIANLLAPTLGPIGGYIANGPVTKGGVELLDDSSTAVRRILSFGNPQLDIGAMIMRHLVWNVGQRIGDGGTTAAVLAQDIFNEGLKLIAAGANATRLARGINQGVGLALAALREQAQPIVGENELAGVARTITGESSLSAVIGEMSYLLGADAHVTIDKYVAPYLHRRYIPGARYKAEIASMYFYSQPEQRKAVLNAPAVALVDDNLTEASQAITLMEAAIAKGCKALVIVAKEVRGTALSALVANHRAKKEQKKISVFAVKIKEVGDERTWALTDLGLLSGATLLGSQKVTTISNAGPEDLGQAQRAEFSDKSFVLVANPDQRTIIQQEAANIRSHIATLDIEDETYSKFSKRLGVLTGGVGELKIGATSKRERKVLHDQAERSFKVLSAAQKGGVVAGGGAALLHCATALQRYLAGVQDNGQEGVHENDIAMGIELVRRSLSTPLRQIATNAGVDAPAVFLNRVQEAGPLATFDAFSQTVVDAYERGILDAVDVVATALEAGASGAAMALTTDAIVYHKNPTQSLEP